MFKRGTKLTAVLGISVSTLLLAGIAGAQSTRVPEAKESKVAKQEVVSEGGVEENAKGSSRQKETQVRGDAATSITQDIDRQGQREATVTSQARPREKSARVTHKGYGDHSGGEAVRISTKGHESTRLPQGTPQPSAQRKKNHQELQEQQAHADGLQQSKTELEDSADRTSTEEQMKSQIAQLRADVQAGLIERPPASGGNDVGTGTSEREGEIAREDIVARPVAPISYARYVQIYKTAAKRYGFAKDWYVLAAVGKTESNHGENMGPSSAGALGPMQFLPSTWKEYGVDGNGDGVANIMDPEDAIPAAAAYLKAGGAPENWYAALYTYNHSGWYVRDVLEVAEDYRRQARDDGVKPYT